MNSNDEGTTEFEFGFVQHHNKSWFVFTKSKKSKELVKKFKAFLITDWNFIFEVVAPREKDSIFRWSDPGKRDLSSLIERYPKHLQFLHGLDQAGYEKVALGIDPIIGLKFLSTLNSYIDYTFFKLLLNNTDDSNSIMLITQHINKATEMVKDEI